MCYVLFFNPKLGLSLAMGVFVFYWNIYYKNSNTHKVYLSLSTFSFITSTHMKFTFMQYANSTDWDLKSVTISNLGLNK